MKTMNILITGSTGMVGKAILLEALEDERIEKVILVNRRSLDLSHPKVHEILLADFSQFTDLAGQLKEIDAVFHCMGVSVIGLNEETYTDITYTITTILADLMYRINPQTIFHYVSGAGTDSSEQGPTMWARVKGKTENYILGKGFRDAYMIRLGALLPEKGIRSNTQWYQAIYIILRPFYSWLKKIPSIITTTEFGKGLLNTLFHPQQNKHLENIDIKTLSTI